MDPHKSRLLIAEMVVPPTNVSTETCWYDITMLTFAGRERTKDEWSKMLDEAGLRLEKIHSAKGTDWAVVEGRLK